MRKQAGNQYASDSFEQHTYQNAQQVIIILDAAITTQAQGLTLLPNNSDKGYFGNVVYQNCNGTIQKWSTTTV